MKEWMVRDPNTKGIIITFPASEEHDAREWMREHDRYIKQEGSSLHGATLELVEFETREERVEKAVRELVEAYGEMEKGIDDPILCHYNSMRLHNAVEDQRVLVIEGYKPNYMPMLDDETEHPEPTVNNEIV